MQDRPAEMSISAVDLCTAYVNNETTATSRYKGKTLEVTGIVNTAGRNSRGNLFVTLQGGGQHLMTCYFLETEASKVVALAGGQTLTVNGRDDTSFSFLVTMRDCVVAR